MPERKKSIAERRKKLRELLNRREKLIIPGAYDALSARIIKGLGFETIYLGGYTTGAHLATTEPLMTLTEQIAVASWIVRAVDLPLSVDGDAGFGDVLHTIRTVEEFEYAGVAGIHLEDQVFPKRVSYHKGLEHIIPLEEFEEKIHYALSARQDPNFIIIGRTDAARAVEGSYDELVKRSKALIKMGVDVLFPFPSSDPPMDMVRRFRKDVPDDIPTLILGGPEYSTEEYWNMGYNMVIYHLIGIFTATQAAQRAFQAIKETHRMPLDVKEYAEAREIVEGALGFSKFYE
ncbi:MAG: isocitrate lyase/PEP mutase family protein, partial [Desulfobacteraceae bacterium]|nr:isocitrate lyase/PEP mutase family protein [Desulfobacteraceae bacterium]